MRFFRRCRLTGTSRRFWVLRVPPLREQARPAIRSDGAREERRLWASARVRMPLDARLLGCVKLLHWLNCVEPSVRSARRCRNVVQDDFSSLSEFSAGTGFWRGSVSSSNSRPM